MGGAAARAHVNVLFAPGAFGDAAVYFHAVDAADGGARGLLCGKADERVASVRKRVHAYDLTVVAESVAY